MIWLIALLACSSSPDSDDTSDPDTDTDTVDTGTDWVDAEPEVIPPHSGELFSHLHGLYSDPFALTLTAPFVGGELRYTLDSRDPAGSTSLPYEEPIPISTTTVVRVAVMLDGSAVMPTQTQTFLFPAHIPQQAAPDDWPVEWWIAGEGGPYEADYAMDSEVYDDPDYDALFPALFDDALIVSLVTPPESLFGPTGIHEHPTEQGSAWERAASFELFDSEGLIDITEDAGLRIQGGAGRRPERSPKKSWRVAFREVYGAKVLHVDGLFEEPTAGGEYDTLVLRAGYNRSWVHFSHIQRKRSQYLRETYGAAIHRDMGHLSPHVRLAHLFLDGLYWGVYQVQERPDASYMSAYLGGSEDDWDVLNSGVAQHGDRDAWDAMMAAARTDLSIDENMADLEDRLDIDAFIDYLLVHLTLGNADWPRKNWWSARSRDVGGRYFFSMWDSELTMVDFTYTHVDDVDTPGELFQALRANHEFNVRFGDKVHKHLFNGGVLSTSSLIGRWQGLAPRTWPILVGESARWGDHMRDMRLDPLADLYTYNVHYLDEHERIIEKYLPTRIQEVVLPDYIVQGLYPSIAAPTVDPFDTDVTSGTTVQITANTGTVYLTTDGTDPRLPGGAVSPLAVISTEVTVSATTTISARVLDGEGWSALVRTTLTVL